MIQGIRSVCHALSAIGKTTLITITITIFIFLFMAAQAQVRTSVQSGNWSNKNTWDCGCIPAITEDVVIASGHRVTLVSGVSMRHLTIQAAGVITDNGQSNTISGHFTIDGTYSGSGTINLTGNNTVWSGTGTISNLASIVVTGNQTILASAQLTVNTSNLIIQGPHTLTHYGVLTVGGTITGTVASSTWINETNATLNIGGSSGMPLMATGTLLAGAPGNTINYIASYAHTLKLPAPVSGISTYHHLTISGMGTKTMPDGDVAINGDLTIVGTLSGSGSNKKIYLRGHWSNLGSFTEGSGGSTLTLDGTSDQYITRSATENFNVLVIDKPAGNVILNTNVVAERGLVLKAGDILTQAHTLTLGLSAAVPGTFTYTAGTIIGKFERWVTATAIPMVFPIGTSTASRPASITFNALTQGTLTATFIEAAPGNAGLPLTENSTTTYNTFRDGYWSLTAGNGLTSADCNLELSGNGFTGFAISDNTRILSRNGSSQPWSLSGTHEPRTGNTVRRRNVSILSGEYALGDDTPCIAPQTPLITGNATVCQGAVSETYSVMNTPGHTYRWRVSGGTVASGAGTHSITVNWGTTGMIGEVAVVEKNACTEGAEVVLKVNIHALPPVALTGKWNVPEQGPSESYAVTAIANYTYTWTVVGGVISSGQGTNSIAVSWGTAATGSVCVVGQHAPALPAVSCGQSVSLCAPVTIYKVIRTVRSGNWQAPATWECACVPAATANVMIGTTHTVSLTTDRTIRHLSILAGGTLNMNSNTLTIQGDLLLHGTLTGTGPIMLQGSNTTWDGIGSISNTGTMTITGNRTILPTAQLTKSTGTTTLGAGVVVTNQGSITLGGNLAGTDANSRWVNAANATLRAGGDVLTTGKLEASAPNNTLWLYGSAAQAIPMPTAAQYANLSLSGTGAKTAPAGVLQVSGHLMNEGIFQAGSGTVAFNGISQLLGSAITTFQHLTLTTGSTLTLPSGVVEVQGNLDFEPGSTFDPTVGTISLTGNTDQVINAQGAASFDLRVSKPSGAVTLTSPLALLHRLTIQSPTQLHAQGNLIITSRGRTTDQDAGIGAIPAGAAITGNVQVHRYMHAIGQANRYISSPVQNLIPALQWGDDFALGNGSIRYYHEPIPGIHNNGFVNHPLASPLQTGRGYLAWMYQGTNPVTWDVEGLIHQGSVVLPMSYTPTSGGPLYDGWNLIGNPYPSAIQWSLDATAWTRSADISPVIYVTDMQTNVFRMYNAADQSGDLTAGVVAMGQSFWVKATQENTALTIHEAAKTTATGTFYRTSHRASAQASVKLSNEYQTDVAYLKTNPKATTDFDHHFDGHKLRQPGPQVYFIDHDQQPLAMHTLATIGENEPVRMGVEADSPGTYHLTFEGLEDLQSGVWYLVDRWERTRWQVQEGVPYAVAVTEASTPVVDRFYLIRTSAEKAPMGLEQVAVYPNPVREVLQIWAPDQGDVTLTLLDKLGNTVWTGAGTSATIDLREAERGIYFLRITRGDEVQTLKIIKYGWE
jgi:hypothetical protein